MGKFVESKLGLLRTHFHQRTQIIFKFGSHFPHFNREKQQNVSTIRTVIFTNFGQAILVNFLTLVYSKMSLKPLLLLTASHNCLLTNFEQVRLWEAPTHFPLNFAKFLITTILQINCEHLHLKLEKNLKFCKILRKTLAPDFEVQGVGTYN